MIAHVDHFWDPFACSGLTFKVNGQYHGSSNLLIFHLSCLEVSLKNDIYAVNRKYGVLRSEKMKIKVQ
jgi:hypothetical protein